MDFFLNFVKVFSKCYVISNFLFYYIHKQNCFNTISGSIRCNENVDIQTGRMSGVTFTMFNINSSNAYLYVMYIYGRLLHT